MVDFGVDLDPMWGPKAEQEEPQEEPKSSQDEANQKYAFRVGTSSLFGSGSGPRRSPAEAKDAILQAKKLQKRGSKNETKKVTKNDDEGTKTGPRMGPKKRKQKRIKKWTLT